MRKLSLFLSLVLVCSFGSVFAQGGVSVDAVTNTFPAGNLTDVQLIAGQTHRVSIRFDFTALTSPPYWIQTNAFEVYSPDGADWTSLTATLGPLTQPGGTLGPTVGKFLQHYEYNAPSWVRTASSGAVPARGEAFCTRAGFYFGTVESMGMDGFDGGIDNGVALYATFSSLTADEGLSLCFDSCLIQAWEWAQGSYLMNPPWDNGRGELGPICWEVYIVPNQAPVWDTPNPSPYAFNHCDGATFDLNAHDVDLIPNDPPVLTYSMLPPYDDGNYGSIDPVTGTWTWGGMTVPQSGVFAFEFQVSDGQSNAAVPFVLNVTVQNTAPEIDCPGGIKTVSVGSPASQSVGVSDPDDCDLSLVVSVTDDGGVAGLVAVVGNVVTFTPALGDELLAQPIPMMVQVTDGELTAECQIFWNVIVGSPYQVYLEKIGRKGDEVFQGQYYEMSIMLKTLDIAQGIGGFNFLVAYDASALSFQTAIEGDIYDQCGWEFFTYRFGPDGNCGNGCPSGILRVVGMAETNNGPNHPDPACVNGGVGYWDAPLPAMGVELASLKFLVSNDYTLNCNFVPVRFFWMECGDNTISNWDGSELYLSENVFDFADYDMYFIDGKIEGTFAFPTFGGNHATLAAEGCYYDTCIVTLGVDGPDTNQDPDTLSIVCKVARGAVDFQNGGFDIVCADSIDARGDINLNGLPYEIADAVMFTNYFIEGLAAFGTHADGSIAASDTNADGLALTVADLVYLIRVVVGDAQPYDKTSPVAAKFAVSGDVYSIDVAAGAAFLVFEGNVQPELLASNMTMKTGMVGSNMHALIYSDKPNQTFEGAFVRANGRLVSSEFATYQGQPMAAKLVPASFLVEQNYPNPFNAATVIRFAIPNGGAWKVDIYNITGQLVESLSGVSESGFGEARWDASPYSSGIYFYKVSAGDYSMTKKMVYLK